MFWGLALQCFLALFQNAHEAHGEQHVLITALVLLQTPRPVTEYLATVHARPAGREQTVARTLMSAAEA